MDAMRPVPVGNPYAVRLLRPFIFTGLEAATVVYPKGYTAARLSRPLLGWLGPLLTAHATDPLPASRLFIAVTPDEIRIFGKPMMSSPFEIGRWKKGSYKASVFRSVFHLKLDLELERLGRIRLRSGLTEGHSGPVFDLVIQGASGPVTLP